MNLLKAIKKQLSLSILYYLRLCARLQLKKTKATVVGVTGTSGKTSACSAIEIVLQSKFLVKKSYKANSESGLPLNILNLSMTNYRLFDWLRILILAPLRLATYWPKHQIYIAEMAIDSPHWPKNMSYLLSIFKPKVGVFLNASTVHGENFDNLASAQDPVKRKEEIIKLIATEKGKLIQSLSKNGLAVLNVDDQNVYNFKNLTPAKVLTFGKTQVADVKFTDCSQSLSGTSFAFRIEGQELSASWSNYLLPKHYGHTIAAALAVGMFYQVKPEIALASLEKNFALPPGRSTLIKGWNNSLIIDSSYNSSINPLLDFLTLLSEVAPKRKLALIGDMRELGQQSAVDHQLAAKVIAKECDQVFLVGPETKKYIWPYLKKKKIRCSWHINSLEAGKIIKKNLLPDDVILVKGSQNQIFLETAIQIIMANPKQADVILCRRGKFWDKKRAVNLQQST